MNERALTPLTLRLALLKQSQLVFGSAHSCTDMLDNAFIPLKMTSRVTRSGPRPT